MLGLPDQVSALNRIGQKSAAKLKKLGLETVEDLIFYYPFRYEDFSQILPISELRPGLTVTVRGKLELLANRRSPRKRTNLTEGLVSDESGSIKVIWFNQPWIAKNLRPGDEVFLSGKISGDLFALYFNSPSYEKVSAFSANTARIVPVYSLTAGLSQKQIRYLVKSVWPLLKNLADYLPPELIKKYRLWPLNRALSTIHFPANSEQLSRARRRLAFDELFFVQLWSQLAKKALAQKPAAAISFAEAPIKKLIGQLSFELTAEQKKAAWQIIKDLGRPQPMNRLLAGDVGSGKTVVAALAIYNAVLAGRQVALMAPTEILARQHYQTLSRLLAKTKIKVGLSTREQKIINGEKIGKKDFLSQVAAGKLSVVVGTHALIQKEVKFASLALVVIDEQHRFGVAQRQALKCQGSKTPHFLSLTATPIPRSLALALYGDLDLSLIKELPRGRRPIITKIVADNQRQLAYNFIDQQIKAGRQVFVVCPLIDPSDKLGVRSAVQEFEKLDREVFPHWPMGLLHGRLKASEREEVMAKFVAGENKILVATSVIEVGIDVPNATVMMIEGAERFGLAQLHQFRGRVGRGDFQSYCFLFSEAFSPETTERLQALVNYNDGLTLAKMDLALRGAGKFYTYEQSGFGDFRLADLNDLDLIKEAKSAAEELLANNDLVDFPELEKKIKSLNFASHWE